MAKKKSTKKKSAKKSTSKKSTKKTSSRRYPDPPDATGKHLVIVESPTKAKTINKYLGSDYVVLASVGHVRDLPSRNPKGVKAPVPGVDIENNFNPTYDILTDKKKTVSQLKKAAKQADDIWFATDLDREGEAIAWHLAKALGVHETEAKRVVFNAITKDEIAKAFSNPNKLDLDRVNAQQARRILDRIVGYQVSPLLWKKVAGGLSAGRVQSVAVRLVVDREREIDAFIPEESWRVTGYFTPNLKQASKLSDKWQAWIEEGRQEVEVNGRKVKAAGRPMRERNGWLNEHESILAELEEIDGTRFTADNADAALEAATKAGFAIEEKIVEEDPKGKGPAATKVTLRGRISDNAPDWRVQSITTKRHKSKPYPPFITSTLQQAASTQLSFAAQNTMRVAQQLYEGIEIKGQGQTGLITYMRTDSTHLSTEAIDMARTFIDKTYGPKYLPDSPRVYKSSNKSAQEAHEAIRPTDVNLQPHMLKGSLSEAQFKLYRLIWNRFVSCQMTPAEWDSTVIRLGADVDGSSIIFKCTGRTLVFDGFYKAVGIPKVSDELVLPELAEDQPLAALDLDPTQHFSNPPPRYNDASLVKKLEAEGIGRPSTYAAIIQVIQNRKYTEKISGRFHATDLGMVVTDKLIEGFPKIMDIPYTRHMEAELDKVEESNKNWVEMLKEFYSPFKTNLERAHEEMTHAKAETQPAPYKCEKCSAETMYRFGKNGRFLSCTRYPDCDYAAPIDRQGKPMGVQFTDILCPICNKGMTKRTGRFGPFLGCENYPECKGIVNIDAKKGCVKLPKPPPLATEVPCAKCEEGVMNLRRSKRGPWMSCNRFPKCRGRVGWKSLEEPEQTKLEKALNKHEKANPVPAVKTRDGRVLKEEDEYVPILDDDDIETTEGGVDSDAA